jgi:hypothetical protein
MDQKTIKVEECGVLLTGEQAQPHIHMPCQSLDACPLEQTESARQAKFARDTGIHCGRGTREVCERLLNDRRYNLNLRQLKRALDSGMLYWCDEEERLKVKIPLPDRFLAYGLLLTSLPSMLITWIWFVFLGLKSAPLPAAGVLLLALLGACFSIWNAGRNFFNPRNIAVKVGRILDKPQEMPT